MNTCYAPQYIFEPMEPFRNGFLKEAFCLVEACFNVIFEPFRTDAPVPIYRCNGAVSSPVFTKDNRMEAFSGPALRLISGKKSRKEEKKAKISLMDTFPLPY